jgi:hypothetical protein
MQLAFEREKIKQKLLSFPKNDTICYTLFKPEIAKVHA